MSSRFYSFLWILFFAVAGVLWLAGSFGLTALVAFGFVMFGLVFTGMMCVLPGVVSHPPARTVKPRVAKKPRPTAAPQVAIPADVRFPIGYRFP